MSTPDGNRIRVFIDVHNELCPHLDRNHVTYGGFSEDADESLVAITIFHQREEKKFHRIRDTFMKNFYEDVDYSPASAAGRIENYSYSQSHILWILGYWKFVTVNNLENPEGSFCKIQSALFRCVLAHLSVRCI